MTPQGHGKFGLQGHGWQDLYRRPLDTAYFFIQVVCLMVSKDFSHTVFVPLSTPGAKKKRALSR